MVLAVPFCGAPLEVAAGLNCHIKLLLVVSSKQVAQGAAGSSATGRRDEADELIQWPALTLADNTATF
jgi:hypothetical protein